MGDYRIHKCPIVAVVIDVSHFAKRTKRRKCRCYSFFKNKKDVKEGGSFILFQGVEKRLAFVFVFEVGKCQVSVLNNIAWMEILLYK